MLYILYNNLDVTSVLLILLVLFGITLYFSTRLPKNFPPSPAVYPVFGSMHALGKDPDKAHIKLAELSQQYGPILGLKIGSYPAVCLNSLEIMKEALVQKGDQFRHRPHFMACCNKFAAPGGVGKARGIGWTNGEQWRNAKRFALSSMRGFGLGKKTLEERIQEEAVSMCHELKKVTGQPYDVSFLFGDAISNVVCSICFGTRFEYTDPVFSKLVQMLRFIIESNVLTTPVNFIPIMRLLPEPKLFTSVMDTIENVQKWMENQTEKHRETYDPKEIRDMLDLYLSKEDEENGDLCAANIHRIILDLFMAGTDATATDLRWALLFLIHHPNVQSKCQEELDAVIGSGRPATLADRKELPYMDAVIHETLRLIATFTIPHAAECDTTLAGYDIPKGTMVMVNLAAVHLNSKYFKNPKEFQPERFIGPDGTFQKHDAFIAFGMGPRNCMGESLARSELFLFLTSMLQRFTFRMVDPENPPSLDGKQGISYAPRMFEVITESR